jgi:hypothetical protein
MASALGHDISKLTRSEKEEWMSYDKFKTTVLGEAAPTNPPAYIQADTRNENALNELVQVSDVVGMSPSYLHMHGNNGINASYAFDLPPSAQNVVIGKKLSDEWWVKAIHVFLPSKKGGGAVGEGEEYYLLSHSEGFNFKNKLIKATEFSSKYGIDNSKVSLK